MEHEESRGFHGYRRPPPPLPTSSAPGMKQSININMKDNNGNGNDDNNECIVREQDRFMPIANVIRIMRKILPPHAKISDDAKETIQECVSEYISFITGEANERCQREQRKTITAEDVLWAMSKLGFDDYIEPLTFYLNRYRDLEGDRGGIRGDPLVKRVPVHDPNSFNMAAAAAYGPMGGFAYQHHQGGGGGVFYPQMSGGYIKDAPNTGSSYQAVAGMEHHTQYAPQGNNL